MKWTAEYINSLPDSCFAYIEPGGTKDGEGKTVPRRLRHLPYKDENGKIDLPHLRNALARLPQTNLSVEAKRKAKEILTAAAREVGLPSYEEQKLSELKIPFFRLGKWRHPVYGVIQGTQEKFDAIRSNFKRNVLGRPPFVRLGHTKDEAATYGDAPAEAWVHDIIQEGDVLYALAHPTSDEIVDAVKTKRYRFASPEYQEDYIDKETGASAGPTLVAIGLTNEPFLTRLPDTVALAEQPDKIYQDYEEVRELGDNDFIKKLTDAITKFFENFKPAQPSGGGLTDEERRKLAEIDELKTKLAQAESRVAAVTGDAWKMQVESRLAALVAKGIPPVMCEQAKAILLASPGTAMTMVKLADGKEISLAEQVFATLEALPEEHRVKLAQIGKQDSTKPGVATVKEIYGDVVPELAGKK